LVLRRCADMLISDEVRVMLMEVVGRVVMSNAAAM
jgi:hypothetical protein